MAKQDRRTVPVAQADYYLTAAEWETVKADIVELQSGGSGIGGSGTANRIARFTDTGEIGDSRISDPGSGDIELLGPVNQQIVVGALQETALQVMMAGTGFGVVENTPHMTEAVAVVGFVTSMTFGLTSNAIGGQFLADATVEPASGALVTNIAVQGTARSGSTNYAWYSTEGRMRQDDTCQFAVLAGSGMTIGNGTVAAADTLQIYKATNFAGAVSLGSSVAPFSIPGSSSINPSLRLGYGSASAFQLACKTTYTGSAETGVAVHCDTSVISTARGGMRLFRGAGGTTVAGGCEIAGGNNSIITGTAANDVILYARTAGAKVSLGTGSTPTTRFEINDAGKVTITTPAQGIAMGASGPTWTSGTGSPEAAVTAPIGSIYSRTNGGAGTTLYVKESGTGNTGWVAMATGA